MTEKTPETTENLFQRQQAWPLPDQKPVAASATTARKSPATPKVAVATPDVAPSQQPMMQLQVNNSGAWKNVLRFRPQHVDAIRNLVRELDRRGEQPSSWRITDCEGRQSLTQFILTPESGAWIYKDGQ